METVIHHNQSQPRAIQPLPRSVDRVLEVGAIVGIAAGLYGVFTNNGKVALAGFGGTGAIFTYFTLSSDFFNP